MPRADSAATGRSRRSRIVDVTDTEGARNVGPVDSDGNRKHGGCATAPQAATAAQIVVAGHICLDVIPELGGPLDVQPGGLVVIGPSAVSTGGPVGNVGMALHRLGVPVRLIAKIGDDMFGRELLSILRGGDPALADGMIVVPGETTSYSVIVNPPGIDRTVLHCAGANDTFGVADVPLDRLDGARILHFGYPPIMRRLYSDGGLELAGLFAAAHDRGLVVSLDTCVPDPNSAAGRVDWVAFLARVLPAVDVFSPSVDELRAMLRVSSPGTGRPGRRPRPSRTTRSRSGPPSLPSSWANRASTCAPPAAGPRSIACAAVSRSSRRVARSRGACPVFPGAAGRGHERIGRLHHRRPAHGAPPRQKTRSRRPRAPALSERAAWRSRTPAAACRRGQTWLPGLVRAGNACPSPRR